MILLKNLLIFFFLLFATNSSAKSFPVQTTPYISDYANLLDPETEARLTKTIVKLRQDLDLELTIATIETRYDYGNFNSAKEGINAQLSVPGKKFRARRSNRSRLATVDNTDLRAHSAGTHWFFETKLPPQRRPRPFIDAGDMLVAHRRNTDRAGSGV